MNFNGTDLAMLSDAIECKISDLQSCDQRDPDDRALLIEDFTELGDRIDEMYDDWQRENEDEDDDDESETVAVIEDIILHSYGWV